MAARDWDGSLSGVAVGKGSHPFESKRDSFQLSRVRGVAAVSVVNLDAEAALDLGSKAVVSLSRLLLLEKCCCCKGAVA